MAAKAAIAKTPRGTCTIGPAESVCRPGAASVPVVAWAGCTTVTAVTVLRSPLAMVVVLWKVDVNGVVADDELVVVIEGVVDGDEVEDGRLDGDVDGEVDGEVDEAETEVEDETEVDVVVWSVDEPPVVEPVDPVVEPVVEPVEPVEPVAPVDPVDPVEPAVDETGAVEESESVVVLSVVDGVEELVGLSEEGSEEDSVEDDDTGDDDPGDEEDGSSEVNGSRIFDLEDRLASEDAGDAAREVVALEVSCLLKFRRVLSRALRFRRSIG